MSHTGADENWTLEVSAESKGFSLHMKDLWRYRDLVVMFIKRDFISVYKQTILGPLWFLVQPMLTTIMFIIVFGGIAKLPTDGIPKILFYLSGLTVWNYFATCFVKTSGTFTVNAAIFGKVYFPRIVVPVSIIISNLLSFLIQFGLFLCFLVYFILFKGLHIEFNVYMLLIPVLILLMGLLGLGFGIVVSSLTTKYRDLGYFVPFGTQLFMYATPVIFPLSMILGKKRAFVMANPMSSLIESFRFTFFQNGQFHWMYLIYSVCFTTMVLVVGLFLFNRTEKSFTDTI